MDVFKIFAKPVSEKLNGVILTAWLGIFAGPQLIIASAIIEGNVLNNILYAGNDGGFYKYVDLLNEKIFFRGC